MSLRDLPLFPFARTTAIVILAVMMLVRLGPLCETMAMAATPIASAAMDCANAPGHVPTGKVPPSTCAMPCAAMPGEAVVPIGPMLFAPLSPWTVPQSGLFGLTTAPAIPPPQTA